MEIKVKLSKAVGLFVCGVFWPLKIENNADFDALHFLCGCGPLHLLCIAAFLSGQVVAAAGNFQHEDDHQAGGTGAPESNG